MNKLKAVKEHRSAYPNPITFKRGDKITIGQKDREYKGWICVITEDGNSGWAPEQYILSDDNGNTTAKYDYSAREIDVEIGDEFIVQYELNEWCWVKDKECGFGWIPKDITEDV